MTEHTQEIAAFVKQTLHASRKDIPDETRRLTVSRLEKVLSVLPDEIRDLFLSGSRNLTIRVLPDTGLPIGMKTSSYDRFQKRHYEIVIRTEHVHLPEDLFIGSVLRELGHVAAEVPPEDEWPASRGDRSRFKEKLECRADAMVWRWGLRHYSMRHLTATYPEHWVERIVEDIGKMLLEEDGPV